LLYNSVLRSLFYRAQTQRDQKLLQSGIELADRQINEALQNQYLSIALEALLLRARMHAILGNAQASLADVAQALECAEAEGFISIFVEAGSPIAEALAVLLKRDRPDSAQSEYIQTILTAFSQTQLLPSTHEEQPVPHPPSTLVEPLTPRELEVLQLIAAGDSNQTIADKLVITARTVKKHSGNIYGKLNASSRTQAVARAHELGLLSTD
jgi:LuxR family transcriptional regulator, maltose regulon positive regulatory protein